MGEGGSGGGGVGWGVGFGLLIVSWGSEGKQVIPPWGGDEPAQLLAEAVGTGLCSLRGRLRVSSRALGPLRRKNGTTEYKRLPPEAVFANTLGLLIVLFGVLVLGALARPSWKRPDADSPDSRQVPAPLAGVCPLRHSSPWGGEGQRGAGSGFTHALPAAPACCRTLTPRGAELSPCLPGAPPSPALPCPLRRSRCLRQEPAQLSYVAVVRTFLCGLGLLPARGCGQPQPDAPAASTLTLPVPNRLPSRPPGDPKAAARAVGASWGEKPLEQHPRTQQSCQATPGASPARGAGDRRDPRAVSCPSWGCRCLSLPSAGAGPPKEPLGGSCEHGINCWLLQRSCPRSLGTKRENGERRGPGEQVPVLAEPSLGGPCPLRGLACLCCLLQTLPAGPPTHSPPLCPLGASASLSPSPPSPVARAM